MLTHRIKTTRFSRCHDRHHLSACSMQALTEPYPCDSTSRRLLQPAGLLTPVDFCSPFLSQYPYRMYASATVSCHCVQCQQQKPSTFPVANEPYPQTRRTYMFPQSSRYHPYYSCSLQQREANDRQYSTTNSQSYVAAPYYPSSVYTTGSSLPIGCSCVHCSQQMVYSNNPGSPSQQPATPYSSHLHSPTPSSNNSPPLRYPDVGSQLVSSDAEDGCNSDSSAERASNAGETVPEVEVSGPAYRSLLRNRQPRKDRLCFTPEQTQQLEASFAQRRYLTQAGRQEVAERVGVSEAQVKTWYQNRRTKWKRNQKVTQ